MTGAPSTTDTRKHGLPPVVCRDARVLILGSLPGEASLAARRYYAHPQNQFWRLLEAVLGEPFASLGYAERLQRMAERRIALWDVIHAAQRPGSLDQKLSAIETRDVPAFVAGLPNLRGVAFNGGTAARIGRRALAGTALILVDLPSSSPAYTLPFADKAARWSALCSIID